MRVEKIELTGFKSFCDRTVFNLHPGITCIVGPNGCGKSNIVDSFKWVLGEQSAKSMRGEKMEEVIFSGSQSKKPKGMAEVSLSLSGLDGGENGGGALLAVTRRLYRSGDSEYMLNRSACRLRDIKDIFLDTGLEVKSYSILEQDRISAILSAKPEERRFLIEEVAGVVKYKVRRNEAQSKLESSRHNLQRIGDVIAEVKRQINYLDRQVRKAERYKRLMEELRAIELRAAKRDYLALSRALEEVLAGLESLREEVALKKARLTQAENEIETRRISLLEREKGLDALQRSLHDREREIAELERTLAVFRTEMENMREYVLKLGLQAEENQAKRAQAEQRRLEIAASRQALRAEIESLDAEIRARAESLNESEDEIARKEEELDSMRRVAFGVSDRLSQMRNEHQRHLGSMESLQRKEEGLRAETEDFRAFVEEAASAKAQAEADAARAAGDVRALAERRQSLQSELEGYRERVESLRAETARAREDLASQSSRLESLREAVFAESTVETLRGEDLRLLASISDVIEVPREYESAIESALREKINGFILPAYEDVRLAVKALKAKDVGRTAFVALNGGGSPAGGAVPEGAIARASDLVGARGEYSAAVRKLLDDVIVVADLEAALSLSAGAGGLSFVTLEGETVEPSGVVIAGKSRGLLALKRQIRELSDYIEGRKSAIEAMQAAMQEAASAAAEREEALRESERRAAELEKELSLMRLRAEKYAEDIERAEKKLSYLKVEAEENDGEKVALSALIAEKDSAAAALEEEKKAVEAAMAGLQEELSGKRSDYEQERSRSVDTRLSVNSSKERLSALDKEEDSIARLLGELEDKEGFIRQETALSESRLAARREEAAAREEELREAVLGANELQGRISAEREVISGESEELRAAERGLRELRAEIEASSSRLSEAEVQKAEHALRRENLLENIRNTHDADLEALDAEPLSPEDEERLPEVRKKLEDLGPVSLGSLEEYESLKERYDFLTRQQEDLLRSIAELEEAIAKINSTTRKRLREAFQALKEKFSEVFAAMFGGGRAELVLTDEGNILETGIDVVAQPPGKRLQNINLLSGGEKSLCALALLFSSFLIKPTPICILDEADAALDESNTEKFAQLIKDLSGEIQFLVVTHNRVTMEAADYIYGLTMEEPGVSKALSMQFSEA